jgi:putative ABC transport system ATP-binding protein
MYRRRTLLKAAVVAALVVAAVVLHTATDLPADITTERAWNTLESLREWILGYGRLGPVVFVAATALSAVINAPAILVVHTAVVLYGGAAGLALSALSTHAAASLIFFLGRALGRESSSRFLGRRFPELEEFSRERGLPLVFSLRFLFFLAPAVSWMLSVTNVSYRDYFVGSLLGSIPHFLVQVWIAAKIVSLIEAGESLNPLETPDILLPFAAFLVLLFVAYRVRIALRKSPEEVPPPSPAGDRTFAGKPQHPVISSVATHSAGIFRQQGAGMSLVSLRDVSKEYLLGEAPVAALNGINLEIKEGEFIAVWGPSGSGKSTLCNLVGIIDTPTTGEVLVNGRRVADLSDDERSEHRNRSVGHIFQNFNLVPVLSALENVMLPLTIGGESASRARQRARELLEEMGLAPYLHQRPDKMSGGQQQRIAIARALVTKPPLLIADEPTANLDSENASRIVDIMKSFNESSGATFIFSTHDQRLLERVGRRIQLEDGTIASDTARDGGEGPSAPRN